MDKAATFVERALWFPLDLVISRLGTLHCLCAKIPAGLRAVSEMTRAVIVAEVDMITGVDADDVCIMLPGLSTAASIVV